MEFSTSFDDVLGCIRGQYLNFYSTVLEEQKTKTFGIIKRKSVDVGTELLMEIGDGTNPQGSRFNLPVRVDIVSRAGNAKPEFICPSNPNIVSFEAFSFEFPEGFSVTIEPFQWNLCEILVEGDHQDWQPILDWFQRWVDLEDVKSKGNSFSGVIHQMSEPEITDQGVFFFIDFGSAPIDAFIDLMRTLHHKGLKYIRVGTFTSL